MKKIVVRKFDGDWQESGLCYEEELKGFTHKNNCDDLYVIFRNSAGSVNSYNIIEVGQFEEGVVSCRCKFRWYSDWKKQVELVSKFFQGEFQRKPNAVIVNHSTIVKLEDAEETTG